MKHASSGLIAFLNGLGPTSQPLIADLLTIVQQNGTITRLTSAAMDVASTSLAISFSDANVYTFKGGDGGANVTFTRSRVLTKIGLEVADMTLTLACPTAATLGGLPWPQAVAQGALDAAQITLERAYMPTWGNTSAGTLIIFKGYTGDARPSRNTVELQVKAGLTILANPMPRRVWQPGCLHMLYDTGCALSKASFTITGTAGSGSTASLIKSTFGSAADHYWELGEITFTSGVLNGLQRTVNSYLAASGVGVVPAFPAAPALGDGFSIYPGCDKTQQTCVNKFNNLVHFAGFP